MDISAVDYLHAEGKVAASSSPSSMMMMEPEAPLSSTSELESDFTSSEQSSSSAASPITSALASPILSPVEPIVIVEAGSSAGNSSSVTLPELEFDLDLDRDSERKHHHLRQPHRRTARPHLRSIPTARPALPSSSSSSSATPSSSAGHSSHGRRSTSRRSRQRYGADLIRREAKALLDLAEKLDKDGEDEHEELEDSTESDGDEADDDMRPEEAALANARHLARRAASAATAASSSNANTTSRRRTLTTFTDALDALSTMSKFGKVVITGVGKSGLLARKAVATFNSLGIQSVFLHPVEALHGDLGSISPHGVDVLILVSYSGKTAELLSLIKSLRKDPPPHQHCHAIISLTTPNSPLAQASDVSLDVSLEKDEEADPAVPAPTSSVLAALAMLDSLALTLLRERVGWDADPVERKATFREFHPGGSLGQQMLVPATAQK